MPCPHLPSRPPTDAEQQWEVALPPERVTAFADVCRALAATWFGHDGDGDCAVEVTVVDRTRYERPAALLLPYPHKPEVFGRTSEEQDLEYLRLAVLNSSIAADRAKVAMDLFEYGQLARQQDAQDRR